MKKIGLLIIVSVFTLSSCNQNLYNTGDLSDILKQVVPVSEIEVGMGLKEALQKGVNIGTDEASRQDGFFKNANIRIPFPPEIQKVESTLRSLGMNQLVDNFILTMNRGAEEATKQAAPIFLDAISHMTISDAIGILKGDEYAATKYLREKTTAQLVQKFSPIVEKALNQTKATSYYGTIASTYNKLPMVQNKINENLTEYATQKSVDGLFYLIAQEEAKIRTNPLERTSEILKRVFGSFYNSYNK